MPFIGTGFRCISRHWIYATEHAFDSFINRVQLRCNKDEDFYLARFKRTPELIDYRFWFDFTHLRCHLMSNLMIEGSDIVSLFIGYTGHQLTRECENTYSPLVTDN